MPKLILNLRDAAMARIQITTPGVLACRNHATMPTHRVMTASATSSAKDQVTPGESWLWGVKSERRSHPRSESAGRHRIHLL